MKRCASRSTSRRAAASFPEWPVWHPQWALTLLATTAIILFLPKLLSALVILIKGRAREFGGAAGLLASVSRGSDLLHAVCAHPHAVSQ